MIQANQSYPEYVTQKEMCVILGVCKSTAYAMQKQGIIPFKYEDTSKGRRQRIRVADILSFQNKHEKFNESEGDFVCALLQYFNEQLRSYPSILTVSNIMRFTGYAKTTINNWIASGILQALQYNGKRIKSLVYGRGNIVTKESFIAFLTSPYYRNISRKSKIHRDQEQEYLQLFVVSQRQGGGENV